jgi:acetyl-CoA synthetase
MEAIEDLQKKADAVTEATQQHVYPPRADIAKDAHCKSLEEYKAMYDQSIADPEKFFGDMARSQFYWEKPFDSVGPIYNFDVSKGPISIDWFQGGKTNICYNALDKHVAEGHGSSVAILWEGNSPDEQASHTYDEILDQVKKFANVLKRKGIGKGDTVTLYMPMVVELAVACLACARIGAIHSVVFGGFSPEAIRGRLADAQSKVIVTCDAVMRGAKPVQLKTQVDATLELGKADGTADCVESVVVFRRLEGECPMVDGRDTWWHDEMASASADCDCEWMDSEAPLFMLYTSGSTGKPKGIVHSTAGYMLGTYATFKYTFDYKPGDVYWCTADIGWITGHSYIVYGPLLARATTVMFEGVPTYPDAGRCWAICEKHKVNQFYTAPTAVRALMKAGDEYVTKYDRSSLRILGSVGEPINPEAWRWYYSVVGESRCPIVDTYWQTETGSFMMTPLPGATPLKPGSCTLPFFGVQPVVLDDKGNELEGEASGFLAIKKPWPSASRSCYGDHSRFESVYYSMFKGYYVAGDGCRRDADGYFWITGRVDDVINVSGHRMGTAEVESALVLHPACSEAAVVGMPHDIKGAGIYCYVILKDGQTPGDDLAKELKALVRKEIGPIATPDAIQFGDGLPKTRSGKIMRRILRKLAENPAIPMEDLGDISTLADPPIVASLKEGAMKLAGK